MSIKKFIENVISPNRDKSQPNHLLMNMEKVQIIEPKPFVSIHVALYNEKRVVERLIRACTSQNWFVDSLQLNAVSGKQFANYEVIIADDSNDETTEIAKKTLLDGGWTIQVPGTGYQVPEIGKQESETRNLEPELEYFIFTKTNAPTVKLIHRFSRSGYKGAALHKALERSSGRAWYIVVMDADFVPYPDTVEQFVKTFQVLNADGLQQTADSNEQLAVSGKRSAVSNIVAVQGYQWHVLNKSQTWVTRGVRTEYAGSYVIERSSEQIYGGLKQIAGSVYAIRADVLRKFGWGTSITEDFELTLRLYEAGYKVLFTPYIQAPAEAVATVKRLIRQRMRWAEGSSYNVKVMFPRIMKSPNMTLSEKMEFIYFAFYYLQAAFFVVGTFAWFISEALMGARLPFWTAAFGWSLVFTNLFALPLMNIVGLFLEESDERDYAGIVSFILISYIVVPFQAYAAIKGFLEPHEGPWFRTPKSGIVTDVAERTGFGKFFGRLVGGSPIPPFDAQGKPISADYADSAKSAFNQLNPRTFAFASAYRPLVGREIEGRRRHFRFVSKSVLAGLLTVVILLNYLAFFVPNASAAAGSRKVEQQINIVDEEAAAGTAPVGIVCVDTSKFSGGTYYFEVVATNSAGSDQTVTFSKGGNGGSPACGSGSADTSTTITITASTTTATRFRTSAIGSYPTGEVFVSSVGANVAVRAARVIILQSATSFTNTQTQIEVGDQNTKTDTSYIVLDDQKDYCFDTTATSTTCSAASSSLLVSGTYSLF
ncbi:MAG: glycosyltransferase family 2 protein [Candidatus Curtissbacteria bacterium]|nr:glycosyltransferase family 2 protein [Candidatus Curtissbacteria bacterium]